MNERDFNGAPLDWPAEARLSALAAHTETPGTMKRLRTVARIAASLLARVKAAIAENICLEHGVG